MSGEEEKKKPSVQSAFEIDSVAVSKKRTEYYDKWRNFTAEEADKAKAEEEEEKAKAAEKLGLASAAPRSEAEKKDMEKRAALREAKKMWDGKKASEEAQIFSLEVANESNLIITKAEVLHRPVVKVVNCTNATITFAEDMGALIKIFVENCTDVTVIIQCKLITQHIELSHSTNLKLILAVPMHTVQLDLVDGCDVHYQQNCLLEGNRVYHAGVKRLGVHHFDIERIEHDYTNAELHGEDAVAIPDEEKQFVTHLKNDRLVTERVRRASGMMPMTDEELSKVAGTEEIETAHIRQAKEKRTAGNEAFANGEYMQAGVFYTQAVDMAPQDNELLAVCLSNRAACNLKLGRLEEALEDAEACTTIRPEYVKGWFRKGIALHAMKQYGPAIESLAKAEKMDGKNKQIREAMGFAQAMLRKQEKEEREKYRN